MREIASEVIGGHKAVDRASAQFQVIAGDLAWPVRELHPKLRLPHSLKNGVIASIMTAKKARHFTVEKAFNRGDTKVERGGPVM